MGVIGGFVEGNTSHYVAFMDIQLLVVTWKGIYVLTRMSCILVLWAKVTTALEGLKQLLK